MTKSDATIKTSMILIPKMKMSKPKPAPKKIIKFKAGSELAGKVN